MSNTRIQDDWIRLIARACHEANRSYSEATGDGSHVRWEDTSGELKASVIVGVRGVIDGDTPEMSHERWCETKARNGWTYGVNKNFVSKTHPCLVKYADLPERERAKDRIFGAIVRQMTAALMLPMKSSGWTLDGDALHDAAIVEPHGIVGRRVKLDIGSREGLAERESEGEVMHCEMLIGHLGKRTTWLLVDCGDCMRTLDADECKLIPRNAR